MGDLIDVGQLQQMNCFCDRYGKTDWFWDNRAGQNFKGLGHNCIGFGQYNKFIYFSIEMKKHFDFAIKGHGQNV